MFSYFSNGVKGTVQGSCILMECDSSTSLKRKESTEEHAASSEMHSSYCNTLYYLYNGFQQYFVFIII
jgi:hypothetical protein